MELACIITDMFVAYDVRHNLYDSFISSQSKMGMSMVNRLKEPQHYRPQEQQLHQSQQQKQPQGGQMGGQDVRMPMLTGPVDPGM